MRKKQNYKKFTYVLLTLFLLVISIISGRVISPAFADTSGYSGVLEDLRKDSSFNFMDYPEDKSDYSLKVIQVAESTADGLFVYVYQPCQSTLPLVATKINMSLTDKLGIEVDDDTELSEKDKPQLYGLTLLNSWGVFAKYKVNGFAVNNAPVRYYNIVSIYRVFDDKIDKPSGNDNTINEKAFKVGKCFKVETVNGELKYTCKDTITVEILNPYVDFVSYYNGMSWGSAFGLEGDEYTDVHYIAFSTDLKIDTLKEADVRYVTQSYKRAAFTSEMSYGEESDPQIKTLTGEMDGSTPDGFLAVKYSWKCIQRAEDFIKNTDLNATAAEEVKKSEFVLVFLTTPYTRKSVGSLMQGHGTEVTGTKVSKVTILRLNFETAGKSYNLGAVMDIQEGDDIPGNQGGKTNWFDMLCKWLESVTGVPAIVWKVLICALPFIILLPVLSAFFPVIGQVLLWVVRGVGFVFKYLFIGLWWVISAPFRLVIWLVHKNDGE